MNRPKFSIIIPVYNADKYLAECIESCINQAPYKIGEDIEVICINDGSTDKSLDILKEYEGKGITVINQENLGVSSARNNGISAAKGEFIWFVDSDDVIEPRCLSVIYERMITEGVDGCAFKIKTVPANFIIEKNEEINSLRIINTPPNMQNACCVIIKREYIKKHNIRFQTNMAYGEDTLFVFYIRLFKHNLLYFDNVLYYYRQVPTSAMLSKDAKAQERMFNSQLQMLNEYKRIIDDRNPQLYCGDAKPRERYYWTIQNILFTLLRFEKKRRIEVFNMLKQGGHYPYPILWERLLYNSNHIKSFLINFFCLFFPLEWYYRLMMRVFK